MRVVRNAIRSGVRLWVGGIVSTALLGTAFVAATAPRAQADDDRSKCQHRIEKAEVRLDRAIRDRGEHSSEARASRRELNEERERCYTAYHGWWSGADRRWHEDRDWDRYDHDRDHDHDRDRDRDHDRDDHH